jgi:hypothetical protein
MGRHEALSVPAVCPECGGLESSVVCQLYECSFNRATATAMPSGFRLSCQRCGCIYSLNKNGVYRHHEQALPWTPKPKLMDELIPAKPPSGQTGPPPRTGVADTLPFRQPSAR